MVLFLTADAHGRMDSPTSARPRRGRVIIASVRGPFSRRGGALILLAGWFSASSPRAAHADTPLPSASSPVPAPSAEALAEAKELFHRGVRLFEAGDTDSALDAFRRSRARFASMQNTLNVAICLEALARDDEALDAYEEVVAAFGAELGDAERASLARKIQGLRAKVGALDVSSNVSGAVVVDGRERAKLPLAAPIRVSAGAHVVRVIKDGYVTFEARVDVRAGERTPLDARLSPLAAAGGLRVEDATLAAGGEVVVDGVVVGPVPWEGTLAPGSHVVASRARDGSARGSAPTLAVVLQGQTALVRLRSGPLGAVARIVVRPASAEIAMNGVPLGKAQWEGSLPTGHYAIDVREDGYVARHVAFDVAPGSPAYRAELELAIDPRDPRWPHPSAGQFVFSAFAGYGVARSLRSTAEEGCSGGACTRHGIPGGVMVGLRGGYELRSGVTIEGAGGYVSIGSDVSRSLSVGAAGLAPTTYAIDDALRVQGFWLGTSVSYGARLGETMTVRPRLGAGFLVAHSFDPLTATRAASAPNGAGGAGETATLANRDDITRTTPFIGTAELWLERAWGSWRVGAGLTALWIPSPAARGTHGELTAPGAPPTTALAGERYFRSLLVIMPQLSVALVP